MTFRRAGLLAGIALAFIVAARLVHFTVVHYFGQPVGQLYRTFVQLIELAPQDWIWAAIIAITVLIGLRSFVSRPKSLDLDSHGDPIQAESLESWLVLLQERTKGAYFGWRLANRLAELDFQIGSQSEFQSAGPIQEYLKLGHDRRTISDAKASSSNPPDLSAIVRYLEGRIESESGS